MSSGIAAALDVYRVSPVRGQLEPPDARTSKGWRYIQCTETPNELKVRIIYIQCTNFPNKRSNLGLATAQYSSHVRAIIKARKL